MRPFRVKRLTAALAVSSCCLAPMWAQSASEDEASYLVTFRGLWTRSVTPGGVPGGAHFSPLIGAVHSDQVSFWERGGRASREMERVAELGIQRNLRALMERNPHVLAVLEKAPPGGGTASATIEFEATAERPLVTLVTMIAPSPDWFVGVAGLSLRDDRGQWLDLLEVDLFPYDAGTEEGTEFTLSNPPTSPQGVITSIRGMGKFTDEPIARLTFERLARAPPDDPEDPGGDEPMPRFSGDVAAEPVDDAGVVFFWRGSFADEEKGLLTVMARSQAADWAPVTTANAIDGRVRIGGLQAETPYTFRLRAAGPRGFEYSGEASATTGGVSGPCRAGERFLCLRQRRFEVQVHWSNPDVVGHHGRGGAVPVAVSDESGLFWFFDPANIELVVKVLDGSAFNASYWVFFGALSDVEYWVTVRDTESDLTRTYHNPPKQVCGQSDTAAFAAGSDDPASVSGLLSGAAAPRSGGVEPTSDGGGCEPGPDRLCLLDGRFAVELRFVDPNVADPTQEAEKTAAVIPTLGTSQTGFFWFFDPANVELAAKMLDGRALNGRFWLIYGGLSDVEYTLTVTDTVTGLARSYRNEAGSVCGGIDTDAF